MNFSEWVAQLDFSYVIQLIIMLAAVTLCITVHETCHGLAAYALGDDTAKKAGRLTLNPIKHISVSGFLMMAICHFGWAKPVPIDMRKFKNPRTGMAVTAIAGPLSNVILAFVAVLLEDIVILYAQNHSYGSALYYLYIFLYYLVMMNCGLAVFNIIPIPPLDGSKVLFAFLPEQWYCKLMQYERYGMILMMVVLLTNVIDAPLTAMDNALLNLLESGAEAVISFFLSLIS